MSQGFKVLNDIFRVQNTLVVFNEVPIEKHILLPTFISEYTLPFRRDNFQREIWIALSIGYRPCLAGISSNLLVHSVDPCGEGRDGTFFLSRFRPSAAAAASSSELYTS